MSGGRGPGNRPYYFAGVSPEGIEHAFAAVLDGVADARLSACLYHIPQVSGVPVPAPVLGRLRARYGATVSGVKDSSGDFDAFLAFRAAAPDVASLVGAEVLVTRALAAGGEGTICGMANLVPALVRRLFDDPGAQTQIEQACAPVDSNATWARASALREAACATDSASTPGPTTRTAGVVVRRARRARAAARAHASPTAARPPTAMA